MKYLVLILTSLFFSLTAVAKIELIVWQATETAPRIILPKRDGETADQAVQSYLDSLVNSIKLKNLIPQQYKNFKLGQISEFNFSEKSTKPLLAINANWFLDMTSDGSRILRNVSTFSKAGADVYVIALAAEINLKQNEIAEFDGLLEKFNLMVSLGGDDVAPKTYSDTKTWSKKINYYRDQLEIRRVQKFKQAEKGVFFGICRGHQLGAVADGHTLYQDLSLDNVADTNKHIHATGTNSSEMQTWHHIQIEDSLLKRFLKTSFVQVNSVHHQAVKVSDQAKSVPVAYDDNIVEALQSKNGLSLSTQFHPEFPKEISNNEQFSKNGFEIIKGIVAYSRLVRSQIKKMNSCQKLFI